jgi:outer membrane protein OmpA-like peptidoglycan-associated protein
LGGVAGSTALRAVGSGAAAGAFAAAGYGSDDPLVDEPTDEARAKNRRVEIVLLSGRCASGT